MAEVREAARVLLEPEAPQQRGTGVACAGSRPVPGCDLPAVQDALHVSRQRFDFSTGLDYNFTRHSLLDEYASTLVSAFRVMHYSGDADPCVPHVGTQRWIASLALPEVEAWHPWTAPGTMPVSGYATRYAPNFTFATVRDAGHMAPRYKPRELLYLFDSWLRRAPA